MIFSTPSRYNGTFSFILFSILGFFLLLSSTKSSTALAAPVGADATANALAVRDENIPNKEQVLRLTKPVRYPGFHVYAKTESVKDKATFTGIDNDANAEVWATKQKLTSVRDIWKNSKFTDRTEYAEVPESEFKLYQIGYNKYFASIAEGKAYLVFPHGKKPDPKSIFAKVQTQIIVGSGKVQEIVWIDENKIRDKNYKWENEKTLYWKKGDPNPSGA